MKTASNRLPVIQQVQMIIGVMLLLATYLTWAVHIQFVFIAGFVGFALIGAGLTGVCPMEGVLKRMPWNTEKSGGCCGHCTCGHDEPDTK